MGHSNIRLTEVAVNEASIKRFYTIIVNDRSGCNYQYPLNFVAKVRTSAWNSSAWSIDQWDGRMWVPVVVCNLAENEVEDAIMELALAWRFCKHCGLRLATGVVIWPDGSDTWLCAHCAANVENFQVPGASVQIVPLADYVTGRGRMPF